MSDVYPEGGIPSSAKVSDMPLAVRPRERLMRHGPKVLSSVELLAIFLGNGTRKTDVIGLAQRIVRKHGVGSFPSLSVKKWSENPGVGPVRACRLVALFELARRVEKTTLQQPPRISTPADVYSVTRDIAEHKKEHLVGLYVDSQNHLIARETISVGTLNTTRSHPREVLKPAIDHPVLGFILVHNHPSGTLVPSSDDIEFTRAIARAGELMGIPLYDHVIVSSQGFVSLKEKGFL